MTESSAIATAAGATADIQRAAGRAEKDRVTAVVRKAADAAFQARVQTAIAEVMLRASMGELAAALSAAGIDYERMEALMTSTREASSPAEFCAFARAIHASPRWLAIGAGDDTRFQQPPAGWETFGSHVDRPGALLEFSELTDDGGMPLWERELERSAA